MNEVHSTLNGVKVNLVAFDSTHVVDRVRWMNDHEFRQNLNTPYPVSERSTHRWLDRLIGNPAQIDLIICESSRDKPIGYTGFRGIDLANQKAESYIGIGEPSYRGGGFAREATLLALRYLFDHYPVNMVYALVREENNAAIRLHHALGYRTDGVLRDYLYSHGRFRNIAYLSLLREDFFSEGMAD